MSLEIDHIFVFVETDGPEPDRLETLGLAENYRRDHPGQGTSNICYCFDNAYLELLWLVDEAEARSPAIARTRLAERAAWRENGACPFGIALRRVDERAALPFATWNYQPPYLPEGVSIPVAEFSDDPAQPFVFRSPGSTPPNQWRGGRATECQRATGLRSIDKLDLVLAEPAAALQALADSGVFQVQRGDEAEMTLTLSRDGEPPLRLSLPDCRLL